MGLEALKFLVGRQIGIFVVEMHHEPDRNQPIVEMIKERAAARAVVERPAERVLHQAGAMFFRCDLPQLFQAEAEFLRLAAFAQAEAMHERLGEAAARALGEQRVFRTQLHAAGEAVLVVAIFGETHIAGGNAGHRAAAIKQHFGGGKARVDFNSQRFRLGRQPATDITE